MGDLIEILFQDRVEKQVTKAGGRIPADFFAMIEKIQQMDMNQLRDDKGLHWEPAVAKGFEKTKSQIYTLRINRGWRAICILHARSRIEILAVKEHDKVYK